MRCEQANLAACEIRTSEPQVRQETFFSEGGGTARNMLENREGLRTCSVAVIFSGVLVPAPANCVMLLFIDGWYSFLCDVIE